MLIHTHCHYDSSLLDGSSDIHKAIARAKELGMTALAITDHGTMQGVFRFHKACREEGIKPLVGCEFYMGEPTTKDTYHVIIIAKNRIGYTNLCHLTAHSSIDNFYKKPRVTRKMLQEHKEGLIVTSACIGGELAKNYNNNSLTLDYITFMLSTFGNDFYIEIQPNSLPRQRDFNHWVDEIGLEATGNVVVGCDMHYVYKEDFDSHDSILAKSVKKKKADTDRFKFTTNEFYMLSEEEVRNKLNYLSAYTVDTAIHNTNVIADKCEDYDVTLDHTDFPIAIEGNQESEFSRIIQQGFERRYKEGAYEGLDINKVTARIQYEYKTICEKGYAPYFLIVYDFVKYARDNNIPIGCGRGSVAGSEIAYVLRFSYLEPIKHGLLFERFLSITRNSLPDIDTDVCYFKREQLITYIRNKYGADNTAQIIAEGTFAFAKAFNDVLSVYDVDSKLSKSLKKLIPKECTCIRDLYNVEEIVGRLNALNPNILRDMEYFENLVSHNSKHAAGIIIAPRPVYNYVPCLRDSEENNFLVTAYDKKAVEKCGIIKFDLLGLKLLSIFDITLKNIKRNKGIDLTLEDLFAIDLEDENIYKELNSGETFGLFQFEGDSAKDVLLKVHSDSFNDLIACESICRPGVKEAEDYIKNRTEYRETGTFQRPSYYHHIAHILDETYGCIVYQEQTMRILNEIGGFTLGEADALRKVKSLEEYRERFVNSALAKGFTTQEANELFDRFSLEYSFNKSHAGVYGMNSAITAYLRHYHKTEFMSACMSLELTKTEPDITGMINECRKNNITILSPDINKSTSFFEPYGDTILMPITIIAGIGDSAIEHISSIRPFNSFEDFLNKVQRRKCNKTTTKKLIKAGCFDEFENNRSKLLTKYNYTVSDDSVVPFYCDEVQMAYEIETLGLSVSRHPLDGVINVDINTFEIGTTQSIIAMVTSSKVIRDKNGNEMAFVKLENKMCQFEGIVFSYVYDSCKHLIADRMRLKVTGKVERGKILVNKMEVL